MTTLDTLTPAALDEAITGFANDVWDVGVHVLGDTASYPSSHSWVALLDSLKRRECPPLVVLTTIVGWVCFMMRWNAQTRPLTDNELLVRAAAWRLSDALARVTNSQCANT